MVEFKINGRTWKVKMVNPTDERLCAIEDQTVWGITNYAKCEIYLANNQSNSMIFDTLCHELAHAYIMVYGHSQYESFSEENVCDLFGAFAVDLVRNARQIFIEMGLTFQSPHCIIRVQKER